MNGEQDENNGSHGDQQEEEYVVEVVKGWRFNARMNYRKEFLIKWLNFPDEQNTFEPIEHLNCQALLHAFIESLGPEELSWFNAKCPAKLNGFQRKARIMKCLGVEPTKDLSNGHSSKLAKKSRLEFKVAIHFDDSTRIEHIGLDDFFKYVPGLALEFFEERFVYID